MQRAPVPRSASSATVPDEAGTPQPAARAVSRRQLLGLSILFAGMAISGSRDGGDFGYSLNEHRSFARIRGAMLPVERVSWKQSPEISSSAALLYNSALRLRISAARKDLDGKKLADLLATPEGAVFLAAAYKFQLAAEHNPVAREQRGVVREIRSILQRIQSDPHSIAAEQGTLNISSAGSAAFRIAAANGELLASR